jgi:hypothetical protein
VSTVPNAYNGYGIGKYPWGNTPAFDVLKLAKHEGLDASQEFQLLFVGKSIIQSFPISKLASTRLLILTIYAALGDLRSVFKTVVDLPQSFRGTRKVVLNDRDD